MFIPSDLIGCLPRLRCMPEEIHALGQDKDLRVDGTPLAAQLPGAR